VIIFRLLEDTHINTPRVIIIIIIKFDRFRTKRTPNDFRGDFFNVRKYNDGTSCIYERPVVYRLYAPVDRVKVDREIRLTRIRCVVATSAASAATAAAAAATAGANRKRLIRSRYIITAPPSVVYQVKTDVVVYNKCW